MRNLPLLPTMGVGSYATPGWLFLFREHLRDGTTGPADIDEAFEDATRIAIADQVEAGIDLISDGELRRMRFVYEMYDRLQGMERVSPVRKLGVPGYDRAPHFRAAERLTAPKGLGIVTEYHQLRRLCPDRQVKIAFPGPMTFARNIEPGAPYGGDRAKMIEDIVAIIRAEVTALIAAGADLVQLDEPGFTNPTPDTSIEAGADAINAALGGQREHTAVHICFGNNASRPYVRRDFGRLFPALGRLDCRMLLLEFANREMADIDRLPELAERYDIAAGVIDVKSFYQESAEDVAERIRRVLRHMPAERLAITADCGFSALPRWLARTKLQAMAAGAQIVRQELGR